MHAAGAFALALLALVAAVEVETMQTSYDRSLKMLLKDEGGYVNHPRDPGGATNKGITQRVYSALYRAKGWKPRSVRHITDDEVAAIYRFQYWDTVRGDALPAGLDYAMFDYAVNSGPVRAVKELQGLLKVPVDGHIGIVTMQAVHDTKDIPGLIDRLCDKRLTFLSRLKHWITFKGGWGRRVAGVRFEAKLMAKGKTAPTIEPSEHKPSVSGPAA